MVRFGTLLFFCWLGMPKNMHAITGKCEETEEDQEADEDRWAGMLAAFNYAMRTTRNSIRPGFGCPTVFVITMKAKRPTVHLLECVAPMV